MPVLLTFYTEFPSALPLCVLDFPSSSAPLLLWSSNSTTRIISCRTLFSNIIKLRNNTFPSIKQHVKLSYSPVSFQVLTAMNVKISYVLLRCRVGQKFADVSQELTASIFRTMSSVPDDGGSKDLRNFGEHTAQHHGRPPSSHSPLR
jgi:hypothetical protein